MSFMCMLSSLGTDGSTARTKGRMGGGGGGGGPLFFFCFLLRHRVWLLVFGKVGILHRLFGGDALDGIHCEKF